MIFCRYPFTNSVQWPCRLCTGQGPGGLRAEAKTPAGSRWSKLSHRNMRLGVFLSTREARTHRERTSFYEIVCLSSPPFCVKNWYSNLSGCPGLRDGSCDKVFPSVRPFLSSWIDLSDILIQDKRLKVHQNKMGYLVQWHQLLKCLTFSAP